MGATEEKIIDLDLSVTRKQKIRIDGDDNRILEINISDLNTFNRINEVYPKMYSLISEVVEQKEKIEDLENEEQRNEILQLIKNMDDQMKEYMDYIFDSNVSEICCPDGTMYDPFNGQFRFEILTEKLLTLYDKNIQAQYKKMSQRMKKHTDKYIANK